MEKYPPNSKNSERTRQPIVVAHKKRAAPKGVVQSALGDGVYDVVQYIMHDILAPALKNMVSDALVNMIDMSIFGEGRSRSKRRAKRGEVTSYGKFYSDGRERTPRYRGSRYRFDEIIIPERSDAEEVLQQLIDIAEEYDAVTVADFYELVGMTADYTKHSVGWRTLSRATIVRVSGGFVIDLPEPVNLD